MISLLLASYLSTQTWSWAPVSGATSYRLYFSAGMTAWCAQDQIEFPASVCDTTDCQGEIPEPQFAPVFFIVTAVGPGGEGPGEHGEIVTCP